MKVLTRNDAIQQGFIRYYTGKPCVHGHIAQRNTITGACLQCMGNYNRKRRRQVSDKNAIERNLNVKEWMITTFEGDRVRIKQVVEFLNIARLTPGKEELVKVFDDFMKSVIDSL